MATRIAGERGLTGISFASAGTGAWSGAAASEGSVLVGLERGLDLASHKSQPLTGELVKESDLILGMSDQHVQAAVELGGSGKSFLLDDYASSGVTAHAVVDPFGQHLAAYRESADDIHSKVALVVERLATGERAADDAAG